MTVEYREGQLQEPPVPKWVGVMIAVVLVGSMAGGGALWAWSYYSRPNEKDLQEVRASSPFISAAPPRPVTNSIVHIANTNTYQVRGTDVIVVASKSPNATDWVYRFLYNKTDLVPPEQSAALLARQRLSIDAAMAKYLKVTDDQLAKLKELPATTSVAEIVVTPATDVDKFKSLFAAYIAKPGSDTEQTVVKFAQQIGQDSLAATRASIADRADKIKQILTPEQLASFKQ